MTQAMQFSIFKKPFEEEIDEWATKLMLVSETLDMWLKVQRSWMYLQPIFDSEDIMKQLPAEGKRSSLSLLLSLVLVHVDYKTEKIGCSVRTYYIYLCVLCVSG